MMNTCDHYNGEKGEFKEYRAAFVNNRGETVLTIHNPIMAYSVGEGVLIDKQWYTIEEVWHQPKVLITVYRIFPTVAPTFCA
jgi:hypothetical protein